MNLSRMDDTLRYVVKRRDDLEAGGRRRKVSVDVVNLSLSLSREIYLNWPPSLVLG